MDNYDLLCHILQTRFRLKEECGFEVKSVMISEALRGISKADLVKLVLAMFDENKMDPTLRNRTELGGCIIGEE